MRGNLCRLKFGSVAVVGWVACGLNVAMAGNQTTSHSVLERAPTAPASWLSDGDPMVQPARYTDTEGREQLPTDSGFVAFQDDPFGEQQRIPNASGGIPAQPVEYSPAKRTASSEAVDSGHSSPGSTESGGNFSMPPLSGNDASAVDMLPDERLAVDPQDDEPGALPPQNAAREPELPKDQDQRSFLPGSRQTEETPVNPAFPDRLPAVKGNKPPSSSSPNQDTPVPPRPSGGQTKQIDQRTIQYQNAKPLPERGNGGPSNRYRPPAPRVDPDFERQNSTPPSVLANSDSVGRPTIPMPRQNGGSAPPTWPGQDPTASFSDATPGFLPAYEPIPGMTPPMRSMRTNPPRSVLGRNRPLIRQPEESMYDHHAPGIGTAASGNPSSACCDCGGGCSPRECRRPSQRNACRPLANFCPQFYFAFQGGTSDVDNLVFPESEWEIDTGSAIQFALGRHLSRCLRTELELGFRNNQISNIVSSQSGTPGTGDLESFHGMSNWYWDLRALSCGRLHPYVGAGVGFASVTSRLDSPLGRSLFDDGGDQDSSFAYQWMAGLNLQATCDLDLYAEYRLFNADSLHFGSAQPALDGSYDYQSNTVGFGFRWKF